MKTEDTRPYAFLISVTQRSYAAEAVATQAGVPIVAGTVLGRAGGVLKPHSTAAVDGSQVAVAVLGATIAGTGASVTATVLDSDCEVAGDRLNGGASVDAATAAQLEARGVRVRMGQAAVQAAETFYITTRGGDFITTRSGDRITFR